MAVKDKNNPVGTQTAQLLPIGCALLASGTLLANVLDAGVVLEVVGVVLIVLSAVIFGAVIRLQKDKNERSK